MVIPREPGYRFLPTDDELIEEYLIPKNKNLITHDQLIFEVDFYNFDPWNLLENATREEHWYFFAKKTDERSNSNGCWVQVAHHEDVYSEEDELIGVKKRFQYYTGRNTRVGTKTSWFLTEYHLPDFQAQPNVTGQAVGYIICQLKFVRDCRATF